MENIIIQYGSGESNLADATTKAASLPKFVTTIEETLIHCEVESGQKINQFVFRRKIKDSNVKQCNVR